MYTRSRFHTPLATTGFTLVEILLYFGLLSFFLLSILAVFNMVLDAQIDSIATAHLEQTGQFTVAHLRYEVLNADELVVPVNPGDVGSVLELEVAGDTVRYELQGTTLVRSADGETVQVNGADTRVADISFRRLGTVDGSPSVQMVFTLESTIAETAGTELREYQQTVTLR